jgi:hypothetical protein
MLPCWSYEHGHREDLTAVVHLAPRGANSPDSSDVGRCLAQTLAIPSDVVKVEAEQTPRGTCAGGSTVTIGHTVEAPSVELQ